MKEDLNFTFISNTLNENLAKYSTAKNSILRAKSKNKELAKHLYSVQLTLFLV